MRSLVRRVPLLGGLVAPLVPSDRRHAIFRKTVRPHALGFEELTSRRGWFVRPVTDEIFHVLHHYAGKASTSIKWGVSLAFVPRDWDKKAKFHRTAKSAQLDLQDFVWEVRATASYVDGEWRFRRSLKHAWRLSQPRAEEFWARTRTTQDVAALAAELAGRPIGTHGATQDHLFPGPRLVQAFALASLGQADEARAALDDWKKRRGNNDDTVGVDDALALILERSA